ncbi:unnamed protein product [Didymodactylos carnosus]|uniref:AAA+ ATPase domain-containing protein n=1 Tax=Didymodactylos carnosus TaxID=1234261 RepID=A0A814XJS9_9BILA|nr:unnamed protein product [Didymodactylos carnosus]CAF1216725.1 unnamed protein product [Didymodactylos carnosus]CAF3587564.1 unnamed protein product [Didymodactylos carnosus]CAF3980470.1 unnamed protein product [Didymodactylos carnosus]
MPAKSNRSLLNVSANDGGNDKIQRWQQCSKCLNFYISNEHMLNCSDKNYENIPYVEQNGKYARLTTTEHKAEYLKDYSSLKSFMLNDMIFVSPQTLKQLNIHQSDEVLLVNNDRTKTSTVWQHSSLLLNQLSLSHSSIEQLNLNENDFITIQIIPEENIRHIANITLRVLFQCENQNEQRLITTCLKHQLMNRVVYSNQLIYFVFLGQPMNFIVQPILSFSKDQSYIPEQISSCTPIISLEKDDSNDLTNELSYLSIENNDSPSLITSVHHTVSTPKIHHITTKKFYRIRKNLTKINIQFENEEDNEKESDENCTSTTNVTMNDIGGLDEQKKELIELLSTNSISKNSIYSLNGILLHGSSGCGKTLLVEAICSQFNLKYSVVRIDFQDIYSRHYGESEMKLKKLFQKAATTSKLSSLILVENIDLLCPNRERTQHELERRLTTTFVQLLDQCFQTCRGQKQIFLLATTSRLDSIDSTLRRSGRIDREIEITIPNQNERYQILNIKLQSIQHHLTTEDLQLLAEKTHGFNGADLGNLCRQAAHFAMKSINENNVVITKTHFENALSIIKPSSMREVLLEIPKVKWSDIGGQQELKQKLEHMIVWPIKHPLAFKTMSIQPPKGILMYGPPGCSKTMIAKAVATESGLNFFAVKGPELFSKWVGESERAIREIFRRSRLASPAIIFFDEIDAIANQRSSNTGQTNVGDRVLAQLLNEMDGIEKLQGVTIIAATNRPDCIDPALMRPGRFDRIVYVPLPDELTRREIFDIRLRSLPCAQDIDLTRLVTMTCKYSGAEIASLCDEAALIALQENIHAQHVQWKHFEKAFDYVKPRTSDDTIKKFELFTKSYQTFVKSN